ncbi:DNA damage-binding protein 1a, partial [Tetrabaena socialis]
MMQSQVQAECELNSVAAGNQAPAAMEDEDEEGGGAGPSAAAAAAASEPPRYVEVVDSFANLGPIVDFVVMDLERQGQGQVRLVAEKEVKGAVYNVMPFATDRLLVSVNNKVTVYRWVVRDGSAPASSAAAAAAAAAGGGAGGGAPELSSECSHLGNVVALYLAARGNLVVVGDLMRSVSLLSYNGEQELLEHRAADYNTGWTTAVE